MTNPLPAQLERFLERQKTIDTIEGSIFAIGRKVALASAYNLLHRHNWRKLATDKRNVKS